MRTFSDEKINGHVRSEVGHSAPFSEKELASIETLSVEHLGNPDEIQWLPSLRVLSVQRSRIRDLGFLKGLRCLKSLFLTSCGVEDLSGFSWKRKFAQCVLTDNLIRDISPLFQAERFFQLDLRGNPLREDAYNDGIGELRRKSINISYDDEQVWRLNLRLSEKGLDASFRVHDGLGHWLVPLTDNLQFSRPEQVYAIITPEQLSAQLDQPDVDLADLVSRYAPQPEKKKTVWDNRERGGAKDARRWSLDAENNDALAASLADFVGRFEDATFVRESDELLDYYATTRGPARHDTPWVKIAFPEWLERWRRTLAWAELDESPTYFVAEQVALPASFKHDGPLVFTVRPFGRNNSDFAQALINRHGAFPIGYAGPDAQLALAVDLREGANDTIFIFRASDVFRWNFNPFEHQLFDGLAAMFDAVDELGAADGCAPGELGDTPPKVEFDLDAHVESGDAEQAKAWIEEGALSERLTDALANFVDGFPGLEYVRDTEASLQYYEVINGAELPKWYRQLRKTFGFAQSNGQPVELVFGGWRVMEDEPFGFGPGQVYYDMGRKLISEYSHYPVLSSPQYFLTIRLDDHGDDTLYWSDVDEVDRDKFAPASKYSSAAKMFDAVTAIRASGETIERG